MDSDVVGWTGRVGEPAYVRRSGLVFLGAVVAVWLLPWASGGIGLLSTGPVPGVFVGGALVAGPMGVVAAGVGSVVGYVVTGTPVDVALVWTVVTYGFFGGVFSVLWQHRREGRGRRGDVAGFVASVSVAALAAGSLSGLGFVVLGRFAFFPNAAVVAAESVLSGLVVGGVVLAGMTVVGVDASSATGTDRPVIRAAALLTLAWFVLGAVASIGFETLELVPPEQFRLRGVGFVPRLVELVGSDRLRMAVQTAIGFTLLTVGGAWYRRDRVSGDERRE